MMALCFKMSITVYLERGSEWLAMLVNNVKDAVIAFDGVLLLQGFSAAETGNIGGSRRCHF